MVTVVAILALGGCGKINERAEYQHRIGDAVFTTTGNVEDLVYQDEMYGEVFDPAALVRNPIVSSDEEEYVVVGFYDDVDAPIDEIRIRYAQSEGETRLEVESWTADRSYSSIVATDDLSGRVLIVDGAATYFAITPEMSELLLYIVEQNLADPRSNIGGELGLPPEYKCSGDTAAAN